MIELMFLPFVACVVLVGIHVYLGLHVIERGVIFVDIALAQIAALGYVVAFALGFPFHTPASYLFALGFSLTGALLLALTRFRSGLIPQEAVIGIIYVVAASASILVLNFAPSEAEHIKTMLVGNILFATWNEVVKIALLYAGVGLFHFLFRKQFLQVTRDPETARALGIRPRLWDFFFYASFGVVVTSSVEIGGIFLVFSLLIVPSVIALLFARRIATRLLLGWTIGVLVSAAGLAASYRYDLPTGAAIVCAFGGAAILAGLVKWISGRRSST